MQAKAKRVKYVMTYTKENTNINEHRRVIVKLNNKNISKSAYRDRRNEVQKVAKNPLPQRKLGLVIVLR